MFSKVRFHAVIGAGRVGTAAALSTLVGAYQRKLEQSSNRMRLASNGALHNEDEIECVLLVDKDVETVNCIRSSVLRQVTGNASTSISSVCPLSILPLTHTYNQGRVGGPPTYQPDGNSTSKGWGIPSGTLSVLVPHHHLGIQPSTTPTTTKRTTTKGVFEVVGATNNKSTTNNKVSLSQASSSMETNPNMYSSIPMLSSCTLTEFGALVDYLHEANIDNKFSTTASCDTLLSGNTKWLGRYFFANVGDVPPNLQSPVTPTFSIESIVIGSHVTDLQIFKGLKWHFNNNTTSSTGSAVYRGLFDGKEGNSDSRRLATDSSREVLLKTLSKIVGVNQNRGKLCNNVYVFTRGLSETSASPRNIINNSTTTSQDSDMASISVAVGPILPEAWAHESCCLMEHLRASELKTILGNADPTPHKLFRKKVHSTDNEVDDIDALFAEESNLSRYALPPKSGTLFVLEESGTKGPSNDSGTASSSTTNLFQRESYGPKSSKRHLPADTSGIAEATAQLLYSEFINALLIIAPVAAGILTHNPIQYALVPPSVGKGSNVKEETVNSPLTTGDTGRSVLEHGITWGKRKKHTDNASTTNKNSQAVSQGVPRLSEDIVPLSTTLNTTVSLSASLTHLCHTFHELMWLENCAKRTSNSPNSTVYSPPKIPPSMSAAIEAAMHSAVHDSSNKGFVYGRRYATFGTIGGSVGGSFAPDSPELHGIESTSDALQLTCEGWEIALMSFLEAKQPKETTSQEHENISVEAKFGVKINDIKHQARLAALKAIDEDVNSNIVISVDDVQIAIATLHQLVATHRGISLTLQNHMKALRRSDSLCLQCSSATPSPTPTSEKAQSFWAMAEEDAFKSSKAYTDIRSLDYATLSGASTDEFASIARKIEGVTEP